MIGIGHHARQPRGVEDALFEIEIPGTVLLCHQAALEPVGKSSDHALQIGELLVEIGAQARQLLVVAKLVGAGRFVEGGGEDLVVYLLGEVFEGVLASLGLAPTRL